MLLSPGNLLDRSLGRRVHLRRTSRATGEVVEQEAVIRSGADGAVVLQTEDGIEALRCTGQSETLLFDEVPPDLSAKPTLSVRIRTREPIEATVTLSYLANGFDWQANYVATLSPAGDRIDLFAWLTLANGDETSFAAAQAKPSPASSIAKRSRCRSRSRGRSTSIAGRRATTSDIDAMQLCSARRRRRRAAAAAGMADGRSAAEDDRRHRLTHRDEGRARGARRRQALPHPRTR